MLKRRALWDRIDDVVWAIEGESDSPGAVLGRKHSVDRAPFFVVRDQHGTETVFVSALQLVRKHLSAPSTESASVAAEPTERPDANRDELAGALADLSGRHPAEILKWATDRFGDRCALRFDGAEDVALIEMAVQQNLPLPIFAIDTGRLRPESYRFLDAVRNHYGVAIDVYFPDATAVADLVRAKGPNSFLRDGHSECCAIRRWAPQARALAGADAWLSGRRNDQQPAPGSLAVIEPDADFARDRAPLVRVNPLAHWTRAQVWSYIEERDLPVNELHEQGFVAIGCEPCTRPTPAEEPESEGLWWWEHPGADPATKPFGEGI
jgi:phosphoadenosine phosphosulfate reductase